MRSNPSLKRFPVLRNGSTVRLTDDGPLSSFQGRSYHASLLKAIDGVMSLALCPQAVSQTPQHLISSKAQATCGGCFPPVYLLGHFPPPGHVLGSTPTAVLKDGCRMLTHASLGFHSTFHFL